MLPASALITWPPQTRGGLLGAGVADSVCQGRCCAARQDLAAGVIAANPRLYQQTVGAGRAAFWRATLRWTAQAIWHSAVIVSVFTALRFTPFDV